jgi:hypothetical protein
MATRISAAEMTGDVTRHTAQAAEGGGWTVSWLSGRTLTQNQAVTAMTIAEAAAEHVDDLADNGSPWWLHIDGWAAELGITGPEAVAHASRSPEDHADMPRVRVVLPEPGPAGYLLALDQATGKATVRIDGVTVTMDGGRLQYCAPGADLKDGDAVWAAAPDFSHGIEELAGLINFHVGAWHDFGYETPPAPECKPVPPLGERSAEAIKAGHAAVEAIDGLTRQLYALREQLVGELRQDSDLRGARVDAMLARLRQERQS